MSVKESALLIIDMQNDFCKPEGYIGRVKGRDMSAVMQIIPNIAKIIRFARDNNILTIFVNTIHSEHTDSDIWKKRLFNHEQAQRKELEGTSPGLCAPGTFGAETVEELKPESGEPIVIKHRYSAFIGTDLDLILRSKGIGNVLVVGNATNVCVESTSRHAFMLDYSTVTVSDCVATSDKGVHETSLENLRNYFGYVATSEEVMASLKGTLATARIT